MGVMSCGRKDCDNIMCEKWLEGEFNYYICYSCYGEFEEYLRSLGDSITEAQFNEATAKFKETTKGGSPNRSHSVDYYLENKVR